MNIKINDLSEEDKIEQISSVPMRIRWISNPSEAVQCIALSRHPGTIKHISFNVLTPRSRRLAISRCEHIWKYIPDLTEEEKKLNISLFPASIRGLPNPSEELQLMATSINGNVLQYITNPTDAVKIAALRSDARSIKYISNPTEEMMHIAINSVPLCVDLIKTTIPDGLQELAVIKNYRAIRLIKNPCESAQLAAIAQNPSEIVNLSSSSLKAQILAITQERYLISRITNKSRELEEYVADNLPFCFIHFGNPSLETQMRIINGSIENTQYIKKISAEAFNHFMAICTDPKITSSVLSQMGIARIKDMISQSAYVLKLTGNDLTEYLKECGEASLFFNKTILTKEQKIAAITGCKNESHAGTLFNAYRRSLDEKSIIQIIKKYSWIIKHIQNPSESMKIAAVSMNPRHLLDFRGVLSPEVQLETAKSIFRRRSKQGYYDTPSSILSASYGYSRTYSIGAKIRHPDAQLHIVKKDHSLLSRLLHPTGVALATALEQNPSLERTIDSFGEDFISLYFDKVKSKSLAQKIWQQTTNNDIKVFLSLAFGITK